MEAECLTCCSSMPCVVSDPNVSVSNMKCLYWLEGGLKTYAIVVW
jgi:hypothetical protein